MYNKPIPCFLVAVAAISLIACGGTQHPHADGHHAEGSLHSEGSEGEGHGGMHHDFSDAQHWSAVFDAPERDAWQRPDEVVELMDIAPGMHVADIGAGTGYFEPYLSGAVGQDGRVLALDVEPSLVEFMRERARREATSNVEAGLIPYDDPQLDANTIDRVLIVNTWHHIGDRVEYAELLAHSLTPGGIVFVVDFTMDSDHGPAREHRLTAEDVAEEFEEAGFATSTLEESLPDQYVLAAWPDPRLDPELTGIARGDNLTGSVLAARRLGPASELIALFYGLDPVDEWTALHQAAGTLEEALVDVATRRQECRALFADGENGGFDMYDMDECVEDALGAGFYEATDDLGGHCEDISLILIDTTAERPTLMGSWPVGGRICPPIEADFELEDLDGDGRPELMARWSAIGPSERAIGSPGIAGTIVVDAASGAVQLGPQPERWTEYHGSERRFQFRDDDGDGHSDILAQRVDFSGYCDFDNYPWPSDAEHVASEPTLGDEFESSDECDVDLSETLLTYDPTSDSWIQP